jgi:polysaccharide pyruvyl transferase WcaK-like protein
VGRAGIAVYGYYGAGNLGDDILAYVVFQYLTSVCNPEELLAVSVESDYLGDWFPGIAVCDLQRWFREVQSGRRKLVLGGGGLFYNFDRPGLGNLWGACRATVRTFSRILPALQSGRLSAYALCVGVGPLYGLGARWLTRRILSKFDEISVRDEDSLQQLSLSRARLAADLSLLLSEFWKPPASYESGRVAFVIRAWHFSDVMPFVSRLVTAGRLVRLAGLNVEYVSFQPAYDRAVIEYLRSAGETVVGWEPSGEPMFEFLNRMASYQLLVTMRAHGLFIATLAGRLAIPVLVEPKLAITGRRCGLPGVAIALDASAEDIVSAIMRSIRSGSKPALGPLHSDRVLVEQEINRFRRWAAS